LSEVPQSSSQLPPDRANRGFAGYAEAHALVSIAVNTVQIAALETDALAGGCFPSNSAPQWYRHVNCQAIWRSGPYCLPYPNLGWRHESAQIVRLVRSAIWAGTRFTRYQEVWLSDAHPWM